MPADWKFAHTKLDADTLRYTVQRNSAAASFSAVVDALRTDEAFRTLLNQTLAEVPFAAFRWETPAVTANTSGRDFEFVVLASPGLARRPDRDSFADQFFRAGPEPDVITFDNLGRNAVLVVPAPLADDKHYPHLGAFVRSAPARQRDRLWQAVGDAMQQRLSDRPVWLSTAGAGVSWLHVRLDDTPKYYHHAPYRNS
jgi:hypothetical protein